MVVWNEFGVRVFRRCNKNIRHISARGWSKNHNISYRFFSKGFFRNQNPPLLRVFGDVSPTPARSATSSSLLAQFMSCIRLLCPVQSHLSFAVLLPTSAISVIESSIVLRTRSIHLKPLKLRSIALWQLSIVHLNELFFLIFLLSKVQYWMNIKSDLFVYLVQVMYNEAFT